MSLTLPTINSNFISNRFNTLVCVIDAACVCCEVETESVYDKQINVRLYVFKRYFIIAERLFYTAIKSTDISAGKVSLKFLNAELRYVRRRIINLNAV